MKRKASLLFIFVTLALDTLGLGIVIPVLPDVVRRFVSSESQVSHIYGYFVATYALFLFLSSPLLGRLSDKYGRRPVLLTALFGGGLDYLFMAFAPTLPLLFLGRMISGITGASFTVASSYIADISDDTNRSKNFGVIGAGFGLGFILGPLIGGLLAKYGTQVPFIAASIFTIVNFLFGLFILPESLEVEKRRAFDWSNLNPFSSIKMVFQIPEIKILVIVYFLIQLAGQTHPSIWVLYTQHRYGWNATQVGISLAAVGILSAISQGGLTGILVKRFGEKRILIYGVLGEAIGFAFFGLSTQAWMIYTTLIFTSPFWAAHPALQSLISKKISPSKQGELQGTLMSLSSTTSILNPLIMTSLFAATTHTETSYYLPGSPYLLASLLFFSAWLLSLLWKSSTVPQSSIL